MSYALRFIFALAGSYCGFHLFRWKYGRKYQRLTNTDCIRKL
jgi:hypothetical protein